MKPKNSISCFLILFGGGISGVATATPSLCMPTEDVIFSCSTAISKTISLCVDKRSQLVTYRFGRVNKVELTYSARQESADGFLYNHYFRPSVDYTRILFSRSGYEYAIFRRYDATESQLPNYELVVSRGGESEVQIKCQSHVIDNMSKIINYLKCDESSALGCS